MTDQRALRRRIAVLEDQQFRRLELMAEQKNLLDELIEKKDREIENLKAQVTIAVSPKGAAATGVVA